MPARAPPWPSVWLTTRIALASALASNVAANSRTSSIVGLVGQRAAERVSGEQEINRTFPRA